MKTNLKRHIETHTERDLMGPCYKKSSDKTHKNPHMHSCT